ncbi:lipase family protein [Mycobacterium syngnathidarum]
MTRIVAALMAMSAVSSRTSAPAYAEPAATPGSLIDTRTLAPSQLLPGAGSGYNITYRTLDEYDQPATADAQIYLPAGQPPPTGWPVVSWGKGTVGVGTQCSASAAHRANAPEPDAMGMADSFLTGLLGHGQAIVTTDYIGLNGQGVHHYLNGLAEAHAMIDAVRAARTLTPTLATKWVASGHSQGGQGALVTNVVAPDYAPDLDLRGTVAFAPASNAEHLLKRLSPRTPGLNALDNTTATLIYVLYSLRDARPDLDINDYLSATGRQWIDAAPTKCILDLRRSVDEEGVRPRDVFSQPLSQDIRQAIDDYMSVPTANQRQPILIIHGRADKVVPFMLSELLEAQLDANHATSHLEVIPNATHYNIINIAGTEGITTIDQLLA